MKKLIYDLPIYSMPKNKFLISWNKKINKYTYNRYQEGRSEKQVKREILDKYYPQYIYEYNQIIGYLSIYTDNFNIIYKLHLSHDITHFRASSKVRHFIKDVKIRKNKADIKFKSNLQIKEQIEKDINYISNKYLQREYLIDTRLFYNTIDYLDIISLIDFS